MKTVIIIIALVCMSLYLINYLLPLDTNARRLVSSAVILVAIVYFLYLLVQHKLPADTFMIE